MDSISQYDLLTRFLEDQATNDDVSVEDYKESSFVGKLFYFVFGLVWLCILCQMAHMYKVREGRDREEAARAAEQAHADEIQNSEKRRAKLQSLFLRRNVIRKIEAAHLKPEPGQIAVEEQEDTHVVVTGALDVGETRKDTTRPPTRTIVQQEEPTSRNVLDLKPETETRSDTAAAAAAAAILLEQDVLVDLESGMFSLDDQNQHHDGILKLPEYAVSNVCAICLDAYKAGEMVVWSSNAECQHAFHQDCILDYFANLKEENKTPCPCCRQDFVPGVIEKRQP